MFLMSNLNKVNRLQHDDINNKVQEIWYKGIEIWYNTNDYFYSMELWQQAIDLRFEYDNADDEYGIEHLSNELKTIQQNDDNNNNRNNIKDTLWLVPLLLFLGGCYLDSKNIYKARQCFYRSIVLEFSFYYSSDVNTATNLTLQQKYKRYNSTHPLILSILEYIASYDEEEDENENKCAYQQQQKWITAQHVMTKIGLVVTHYLYWINYYQRSPHMTSFMNEIYYNQSQSYTSTSNDSSLHENTTTETTSSNDVNKKENTTQQQRYDDNNINYSNKPVFDRSDHPVWCKKLEEYYPTIQEEFYNLLLVYKNKNHNINLKSSNNQHDSTTITTTKIATNNISTSLPYPYNWPKVGSQQHRNGSGQHDGAVVAPYNNTATTTSTFDEINFTNQQQPDWREIVLFGSGDTIVPEKLVRKTRAIIRKYCPDAVSLAKDGGGEIIFSIIKPGTHILPHTSFSNLRLTAHLGLIVPEPTTSSVSTPSQQSTSERSTTTTTTVTNGTNTTHPCCYIRVADKICTWEEGKVLVFDDSYEHEVVFAPLASSSEHHVHMRAVLLLRFWHPCLINQQKALDEALFTKQYDKIRRFCPPIPKTTCSTYDAYTNDSKSNYWLRCSETSACARCWKTGYESIHVTINGTENGIQFSCTCGEHIQ